MQFSRAVVFLDLPSEVLLTIAVRDLWTTWHSTSLEAVGRAAKKGVIVVRSSRVATGSVGRNVEVNDDELGLIASDELNPQKARILLSLALLKTRSKDEIQNLFYTY